MGNDATPDCGPDFASWYTPGKWPRCACGFSPRDNPVLTQHWSDAGFTVIDNHGTLETRPVNQTPTTRAPAEPT